MKTNFNQVGYFGAVAKNATLVGLLVFLVLFSTAPQVFSKGLETIALPSGVTDVQIQQALDALSKSGGEVVLPPGKISIRQPIVLRHDNQTLRGSGIATILRLADDANCPVIIMGEPVNHPKKTVKHLRVADLFVDGNRENQQHELWQVQGAGSEIHNNGITVQGVSDSTVENVTCAACRSGGLVTTLGVKRLIVRGLTAFDNEFDGLACYLTTHSVFTDLYLHDNPGAGISLDLAFNHNVISNAVLNANDLGIFMRASRDNQFHNVTIHNSHHFGVFMAHSEKFTADGMRPAPKSECTQNAFTNLIAKNCGSAAFRVNNSTCTDNVIIRPRFDGNLKGGLSQAQPDLVTVQ
jgi:parallel beta-helix repeat protein